MKRSDAVRVARPDIVKPATCMSVAHDSAQRRV
jgi:hypothetical protein